MEEQAVEVYVKIDGDYCAFHEMEISVVYDITNDIQLGYYTIDEIDTYEHDGTYSRDFQQFSAIKIGEKYYVEL